MKLASLKSGRDGKLVVVSDDLAWYADASHIAPTLQAALDDWDRVLPDLISGNAFAALIHKERRRANFKRVCNGFCIQGAA